MAMVVRRRSYPQVDPRATGLMTRAVLAVPATLPIAEAARVARRRRIRLLLARTGAGWSGATPATLDHALGLGLHGIALDAVLWGAPVVAPGAPEVAVRRLLDPGTPFIAVVERDAPVGAVLLEGETGRRLPVSVANGLDRLGERRDAVLRSAGALGHELGTPVAAVGGFVRDLILQGVPPDAADLDLVVEGDGRSFAARLAGTLGGNVLRHDAFLTATVVLPDGRRVDVVTARRERYVRPGALPAVTPGRLRDDLGRRDFSVNALAVRLDGPAWGQVVDPTGGVADLRQRRLRVLHPLSFIEDPTRMFRAARFAVRLRFRITPTTRRLLARAAALPIYDALSGDRLRSELRAILAEAAPAEILRLLGRAGAFRLLAAGCRFPRAAAVRLQQVPPRVASLPLDRDTVAALYLLALTAHLDATTTAAALDRLALPAPARARLLRAREDAPAVATRLHRTQDAGEAFGALRRLPEVVTAWTHVTARSARARRYIADHLSRWRHLQPVLKGDDFQALGLTPGPAYGRLLDRLLTEQAAGRIHDRAEALAWVRRAAGADPGSEEASRLDTADQTQTERKGG